MTETLYSAKPGIAERAEKRLRMSRNCSDKLGDTRASFYSFAIELLLRDQFSAVFKDETVVFKRYFVPLLLDGL